jgi:hypothetical protein
MRQYINLYRVSSRRAGGGKDARLLIGALSLVLLGGIGAGLFLSYQANGLERQLTENVAQRKVAESHLAEVGRRLGGGDGAARILSLEARLKERESLLAALDAGSLGDMDGYADTLRALGRNAGQGVWITGFSVARGGSQLGISGRALDAERIPAWLRGLNTEKVFQGRHIASLKASKGGGEGGAPSGYVDFTLGSEVAAENPAPAFPLMGVAK